MSRLLLQTINDSAIDRDTHGHASKCAATSSQDVREAELEFKLYKLRHGLAMPTDEDAIERTEAMLRELRGHEGGEHV